MCLCLYIPFIQENPLVPLRTENRPVEVTSVMLDEEDFFRSGDGSFLLDSHCHLDLLFKRLYRDGRPSMHTLSDLTTRYPKEFGVAFGGCVTCLCHPKDFGNVSPFCSV